MHRGELLSWHLWHVTSCYLHYRLPRFGAIPAEQSGDITTMCVLVSTCDMCHIVTRIKGTFKCVLYSYIVRSIPNRQCTRKHKNGFFYIFPSFELQDSCQCWHFTSSVSVFIIPESTFLIITSSSNPYLPWSKVFPLQNQIGKLESYLGSQIALHTPHVLHFTLQTVLKTRFNALSFVFPSFENCPNLCSTKDPIAGLVSPRARRDLAKFRHNIKKSPSWLMERYF